MEVLRQSKDELQAVRDDLEGNETTHSLSQPVDYMKTCGYMLLIHSIVQTIDRVLVAIKTLTVPVTTVDALQHFETG